MNTVPSCPMMDPIRIAPVAELISYGQSSDASTAPPFLRPTEQLSMESAPVLLDSLSPTQLESVSAIGILKSIT